MQRTTTVVFLSWVAEAFYERRRHGDDVAYGRLVADDWSTVSAASEASKDYDDRVCSRQLDETNARDTVVEELRVRRAATKAVIVKKGQY